MYDVVVVGGGIVGASCAWQWLRENPGQRVLLLEQEDDFALHQSGRNSGVIHAGIYYPPGSLKAQFCRQGAAATLAFCREYGLPFAQCGKLLVATSKLELTRMQALRERSMGHGIDCESLDAGALREREPCIEGLGALFIRATGMTDYALVCRQLLALFREAGGETRTRARVDGICERADAVTLTLRQLVDAAAVEVQTKQLLVCAGVMADRLLAAQGLTADFAMLPFRGDYFRLRPAATLTLNHHIYPIPDPALPFLGIHLTRTIDGGITVGPNAVLAPGRTAYTAAQWNTGDVLEMLGFAGFWRLLPKVWRHALAEFRNSAWPEFYLRQAQKYCPSLTLADLTSHPSGIRAQAVARDGSLLQDFIFVQSKRCLHVCNAPSPAATAALPIGAHVVARLNAHAVSK